jgi:hypothetical protein
LKQVSSQLSSMTQSGFLSDDLTFPSKSSFLLFSFRNSQALRRSQINQQHFFQIFLLLELMILCQSHEKKYC